MKVTVHRPKPAPPTRVTLEMTVDEAQTLADISLSIGGFSLTSRRAHTDALRAALALEGIYGRSQYAHDNKTGSIYFKDMS